MSSLKLGQRVKLKSYGDTYVTYEGPVVFINEENGWFEISAEVAHRTSQGITSAEGVRSRGISEPFRVSGWLSELGGVGNV